MNETIHRCSYRIQPIHVMERIKHSKEQDEEIKISKQNRPYCIANFNTTTRYLKTTFHNAGENHATIILKKDVRASVPKSSKRP